MEKEEVLTLITYWETLSEVQSTFLNPNVSAKLEATVIALRAYLEILRKAG